MTDELTDLFGRVHLGYLVIESMQFADWKRFAIDGIGLHWDDVDTDTVRFRLDDRECRFVLRRGPAEDVVAVGWHVDDHEVFDQIEERARERGVPVEVGSDAEATLRGVERFVRLPGPKGVSQEIFIRARTTDGALRIAPSGFVTGESGLGHIALVSREPAQVRGYYSTLFNARLSDSIDEAFGRVSLRIRFLRVNERHHSVAVASTEGRRLDPTRTRIQHLNTQVRELDDMVQSYRRLRQLGFTMSNAVGQHTNDLELSYYARTPSGFDWEVGWNPLVVDESTWEPCNHRGISLWGHTPPGETVINKLKRFGQVARNAREPEQTVPALSGAGIPDTVAI